jgi:hypothetical protein
LADKEGLCDGEKTEEKESSAAGCSGFIKARTTSRLQLRLLEHDHEDDCAPTREKA